jgi:hypothetical protein|tara:strand:- start:256 stop:435 length:180 start_codon:yes stop_codon:yes gene_type:complete
VLPGEKQARRVERLDDMVARAAIDAYLAEVEKLDGKIPFDECFAWLRAGYSLNLTATFD